MFAHRDVFVRVMIEALGILFTTSAPPLITRVTELWRYGYGGTVVTKFMFVVLTWHFAIGRTIYFLFISTNPFP